MKKLYLFILLLLPISLMAEEYEVITKDGKKYYGEYVSRTDTTFTIQTKQDKYGDENYRDIDKMKQTNVLTC